MDAVTDSLLTHLEAAVAAVTKQPIPEADIPDAVGRVRKLERDLADWRLGATRELPLGTTRGSEYKVVAGSKTERSYNLPAILTDLSDPGEPPYLTLQRLQEADVIRIQVMWTNLKKMFQTQHAMLKVAHRELGPDDIGDLDAPHVGEWQKPTAPTVEAIEQEADGS
ncbi:MAG: hypothetical protein ABIJ75_07185 [Actinomycetota bacterium]